MSLQKRSVLLAQETDGYATLTDAQQTDAQTDRLLPYSEPVPEAPTS